MMFRPEIKGPSHIHSDKTISHVCSCDKILILSPIPTTSFPNFAADALASKRKRIFEFGFWKSHPQCPRASAMSGKEEHGLFIDPLLWNVCEFVLNFETSIAVGCYYYCVHILSSSCRGSQYVHFLLCIRLFLGRYCQ